VHPNPAPDAGHAGTRRTRKAVGCTDGGAGVLHFPHRNDTATGMYVGGRLAARLKEGNCKGTVWQLGYGARRPGTVSWWVNDANRRQILQARTDEAPAAEPGA
jgi:hypothetical protein